MCAKRPVRRIKPLARCLAGWLLLAVWVAGCAQVAGPPPTAPGSVTLTIQADGASKTYTFAPGLTVREAVAQAGVTLGELDRLTPPPYSLISSGLNIVITRVSETFDVVQVALPYTSETVHNEALPAGDQRLLQVGQPGSEEVTYTPCWRTASRSRTARCAG